MTEQDNTTRFSKRADYYARNRPSYPRVLLDKIREMIKPRQLDSEIIIADIGSGTGIFTRLLLETGAIVYAIEPAKEMRMQAELALQGFPNFRSVIGRAEATTLPSNLVYLVTVAQALHWFKFDETRREFARILVPDGYIALVWNARKREGTSFMSVYDKFLRDFCPDYHPSEFMEYAEDRFRDFLNPDALEFCSIASEQELTWEKLVGRFLSSSYAPLPHSEKYSSIIDHLKEIFGAHQDDGTVTMFYETRMYYGHFSRAIPCS